MTNILNMKSVYDLKIKNTIDPYLMKMYQRATLNKASIRGLKGHYGLYGSDEWWENIRKNNLKSQIIEGIIVDVYIDGQSDKINAFTLQMQNGYLWNEAIMLLDDNDLKLFEKGHYVRIKYVFDEKKATTDTGEPLYSDIVISIDVSYESVL